MAIAIQMMFETLSNKKSLIAVEMRHLNKAMQDQESLIQKNMIDISKELKSEGHTE